MDIYGHFFEQVQRRTADKMDEVLGRKKAKSASQLLSRPDRKGSTSL
jgi:hypothetical protein